MNKKKVSLIFIYIFVGIISLCGCSDNKRDKVLQSRINSEIQYLDKQLIGLMNKLNNITLENYEVKSKEENSKAQSEQSR